MINFLDITHRHVKRRFEDWTLPPSSGKKPTQFGPIDRASPISGHQNQYKAGCINQIQHKQSEVVTTPPPNPKRRAAESSVQKVVLNSNHGTKDNVQSINNCANNVPCSVYQRLKIV
jgi:hypothetical protein